MAGIAHRSRAEDWSTSREISQLQASETRGNSNSWRENHLNRSERQDPNTALTAGSADGSYAPAQTQAHHPHPQEVASKLLSNPYSAVRPSHPTQHLSATSVSRSPPSPPVENGSCNSQNHNKPSLPPIASLLDYADSQRGYSHHGTFDLSRSQSDPTKLVNSSPQLSSAGRTEHHQSMSHAGMGSKSGNTSMPRSPVTLPPTPPMGPDSAPDETVSLSTLSTRSSFSTPPYYLAAPAMNSSGEHPQHAQVPLGTLGPASQPSNSCHAAKSPFSGSPYPNSPYASASSSPYYSTAVAPDNVYAQQKYHPTSSPDSHSRALHPTNNAASAPSSNPNPWQHHHYINNGTTSNQPNASTASSPSTTSYYSQAHVQQAHLSQQQQQQQQQQQPQDRYICTICSKAFSRPSSLRIHNHSHTGVKPYRCPHSGCGKAFSVRSNMKRHERGCHAAGGVVGVGAVGA